jgi:hypothetical protein
MHYKLLWGILSGSGYLEARDMDGEVTWSFTENSCENGRCMELAQDRALVLVALILLVI